MTKKYVIRSVLGVLWSILMTEERAQYRWELHWVSSKRRRPSSVVELFKRLHWCHPSSIRRCNEQNESTSYCKKKRKRRDNLSKQKQWKRRIKFKFYYSWMSLCVNPSPHFHILQHNILCLLSHFPFHAPTSLKKSILITTSVQICEAFIFLHSQNFHRQFNSLHTNFYISTLHSDAHIKLLHNYWLYDVDYVSHADFTRDIDTEFSISRNENSSLF